MATYHWTCPFCGRDTTITEYDISNGTHSMTLQNSVGTCELISAFVVCPNQKCKKYTLNALLRKYQRVKSATGAIEWKSGDVLQEWALIPASDAKVFPDYVPIVIRNDYAEACAIKKLSPKASATLSRRCLQGMIRDFWGISKARLIDEIEAIKDKVDPLTWQAIDGIRSIGNIGAHMEKDINVIVDVDPDEAAQLIGLIEILMKDWYITRYERVERLKSVAVLAQTKKAAAKPPIP
jgi:hypothetical protein